MNNPCGGCPDPEPFEKEPIEKKVSFNLYQCVHGHLFLINIITGETEAYDNVEPNSDCYKTGHLVHSIDIPVSFIQSMGPKAVIRVAKADFFRVSGKQ